MRLLTAVIFAVATLCLPTLAALAGDVSVRGYFRKDGTYVQPHSRSTPDARYNNNWSTYPNVNPNTGQQGTQQPRLYDAPGSGGYGSTWGGGWTQPKPRRW